MIDKIKFMETLRSVAEVAQVAEKPLTREEIISYFDDIELTDEQLTMVFQYLQNSTLSEEGNDQQEHPTKVESPKENDEFEQSVANSKFLSMYLEDIDGLATLTKSEVQALYVRLIDGDGSVISKISDDWLLRVVDLAKTYSAHKVNYEDLIQEGNIGLISGINQLLGIKKMIDVEEYLKESIQKAMEDYIDEISSTDDWEATIIAKTTLINEAKKHLAEENVAIPSNKELADYTKLPEQEIEDIMRLLKDND